MKNLLSLIVFLFSATHSYAQSGMASYYGKGEKLSRYTASGVPFRPMGLTAASRNLPFGTKIRVTYKGKSVIVTVTDRGPFSKGRILDLSYGAAKVIGLNKAGVGFVTITPLS